MTVDHEAVETALKDHLEGGSFGLPILFGGVGYDVIPNEFLFTQIVRNRGARITFTTNSFVGDFIVTHKIKGGGGTIRGAEIGTAVADHFNAQYPSLAYSGGVINLTSPATPLGPLTPSEWIETPISIPFWVMG